MLDKSLSDLKEISITAWVKWNGGASNQSVWHFGSATNRDMWFTPDDGSGRAKFLIRNGGPAQTLVASAALTTGLWTHVAVALSNGVVGRLFVNGILQDVENISITPDQLNGPNTATATTHNYLGRGADPAQAFFNGSLDSVMIYSRALSDSEIATVGPVNSSPALAPVSNRAINVGINLVFTNAATDANLPWQTLTYSLPIAPAGATIDTNTGVFSWRPTVAQANTANPVQVKVTDNGTPNLSAIQNFSVSVNPLAAPTLTAASVTGGQFALQVDGDFGPDYSIQTSTNLLDWATVFSTNSPALPFNWLDPEPANANLRFYRILLGP